MSKDQRDGLLLMIFAASGFAFLPTITKTIYSLSTFEPMDVALWRFIFATPIIWLIVLIRSRNQVEAPREKLPIRNSMLLGVVFSGAALTAFFGLERMPASTYVVLFYTYPAMVVVMSFLLGEAIRRVAWIALVLALIGVALTVPDFATAGAGDLIGVLFCFANAFTAAIYFLLSKRTFSGVQNMLRAVAFMMLGTLLILLLLVPIRGIQFPQNPGTWASLLALSIVCTAMPVFFTNVGIQKIGASQASLISTFEPVMSIVVAMILLGEVILPIQWLGAAFIIGSVMILQIKPQRKRKIAVAGEVT